MLKFVVLNLKVLQKINAKPNRKMGTENYGPVRTGCQVASCNHAILNKFICYCLDIPLLSSGRVRLCLWG